MTREQWNDLIRKINAAWPGSTLTPEQELAYFDALKDLRDDQVSQAILDAVRSGSTNPPTAREIRLAAMSPASRPGAADSTTTRRLVVDVAREPTPVAPYPQAAPSPATAPAAAAPPPHSRSGIAAFFTSALGVGLVCLVVGAGVAVGLTLLLGPDAEAAYDRGVSYGHQRGYDEGDSDGYDRGFDAGKESVFGSLDGADPVSGRFYVVKYGDNAIQSWFDEPMVPGLCYSLRSGFSSDYQLQRSFLC